MDAVIRKALEKDLYSRYKNGAEFAKDLSGIQFKIFDENDRIPDGSRFGQLRKLPFFTEFEDVELWEIVRFSAWRVAEPMTQIIREGNTDQRFGVLLEGEVELSINDRVIGMVALGESFGETAFLDKVDHRQSATVVSRTFVRYLEITPAALALASEECLEHFRDRLSTALVQRLVKAETKLAESGTQATRPINVTVSGMELQLVNN
jgi:non-specific serine/threonine protein kinase